LVRIQVWFVVNNSLLTVVLKLFLYLGICFDSLISHTNILNKDWLVEFYFGSKLSTLLGKASSNGSWRVSRVSTFSVHNKDHLRMTVFRQISCEILDVNVHPGSDCYFDLLSIARTLVQRQLDAGRGLSTLVIDTQTNKDL
jgi:hypothetical protein